MGIDPGTLEQICESIGRGISTLQTLLNVWRALTSKDEAGARKQEFLTSQGRLIALEVGMRQAIALSRNPGHDAEGGIRSVCRAFKENPDESARGISRMYPEYDMEMAKVLVQNIAENLESFLPVSLASHFDGTVEGHTTNPAS